MARAIHVVQNDTFAQVTAPKKRTRKRTPMGAASKTSATQIAARERNLKCVELRKMGATWQAIATALEYATPASAYNGFMTAVKDYPRENVEQVRDMLFDRHEMALRAIAGKVLAGDTWAIDRWTKILEAMAKLTGANRPEKLEISAGESDLERAVRELSAEVTAKAAGQPVPTE